MSEPLYNFGYQQVRVHHHLGMPYRVQFRFPKSKRKRIRKKWARRAQNFRTKKGAEAYVIADAFGRDQLIVSPRVYAALKARGLITP